MRLKNTTLALISAGLISLALNGCSGGGGSSSAAAPATPATATTITGTAAAGAPIIGTVNIKDSKGAVKTETIAADGKYTVDVSGMTGPFIFKAMGTVGGRHVSLVSAATADDVGKTINITPFTDLIVANIAGMAAELYFDNGSPEASKLTTAELSKEKDALTARLKPILSAMGVADSFDLLRTAFSANHSGFDGVMDVVKVEVNPETAEALITNVVTQQQITDDLASKADTTAIAPPPAGTDLTAVVTDLQAIEAQMSKINALYTTTVPTATNADLLALFVSTADGFGHNGGDLASFLSTENATNPELIGLKFSNPVILERVTADKVRVAVMGTFKTETWTDTFEFRKVNGVWLNAGNQQLADHEATPVVSRQPNWTVDQNGVQLWTNKANDEYRRYLETWSESGNANIYKINIKGPGLKTAGIDLIRSVQGGNNAMFKLAFGEWDGTTWLRECNKDIGETPNNALNNPNLPPSPSNSDCIDFTNVDTSATYAYTYYDQGGTEIPNGGGVATQKKIAGAPVSRADAIANFSKWFATLTGITPTIPSGLTDGQAVRITWTAPTDLAYKPDYAWFNYNLNGSIGPHLNADLETLPASTTSIALGNWAGDAPAPGGFGHAGISTEDAKGRRFVSQEIHTRLQ